MSPIAGLNGFKTRMKVAEELGMGKISLFLIFPSAGMFMVSHLHSVCNIKKENSCSSAGEAMLGLKKKILPAVKCGVKPPR